MVDRELFFWLQLVHNYSATLVHFFSGLDKVHQIELELENEEIKRSQLVLEQSKDNYQDFNDFSPVVCGAIYLSDGSMRLRQNEK